MTDGRRFDADAENESMVPVVRLGEHVAPVNYRFTGRRHDDFEYAALMGSVYVRQEAGWRMAFHQQTPLGTVTGNTGSFVH